MFSTSQCLVCSGNSKQKNSLKTLPVAEWHSQDWANWSILGQPVQLIEVKHAETTENQLLFRSARFAILGGPHGDLF